MAVISASLFSAEDGAPVFLVLQVDEVLGIEEAGGVGAVVGAAYLADHLVDFGERGENDAGFVHDALAFVGSGAGREGGAGPDGAFVEVRQEFGADDAAAHQVGRMPRGHTPPPRP